MMAKKTINTVIVLRNDASTAWSTSERVLDKGEVGISYLYNEDGSIKNIIAKVGDGVQTYANLKQIEGVLESDPVFTQTFGKYTPKNGKVTATGTAGMTISEFVLGAFKEAKNPYVNYPTAGLNNNKVTCTVTDNGEIGAYVTALKYETTSSNGSYVDAKGSSNTYGSTGSATSSASGIKASDFTWAVSSDDSSQTFSSTGTSGTYTYDTDKRPQLTSTSNTIATIECVATLNAANSYVPFNNLGEQITSLKIKGFDASGKTTSNSSKTITQSAYRNSWYYVGTDCATTIDSAFIRKATAKNANTTAFGTIDIPKGTKRIMIAVPGTHSLTSVIDIIGQNLDVNGNFETRTVAVEGANGFTAIDYTVFVFENSNGIDKTQYAFTIQ
jgi:hypothetical protein